LTLAAATPAVAGCQVVVVVCSSPTPAPPGSARQSTPAPTTTPAPQPRGTSTSQASPSIPAATAASTSSRSRLPRSLRAELISGVRTSDRIFALTLDDGYHPDPRILDLIAAWHLRGTAFIVGQVAESNPLLVHRLVALGWEVCSHTHDHKLLTRLSESAVQREIARGAAEVRSVSGQRCRYFRPPGGAVDANVVHVANRLGLKVILWNTSLSDITTRGQDPRVQVAIALHYLRPGSILLGHFGAVNSFVVLRAVLKAAFARGYRVGTVTDLLDHAPGQTVSDVPAAVAVPVSTPVRRPSFWSPVGHDVARVFTRVRDEWREQARAESAVRFVGFLVASLVVFEWVVHRRRRRRDGAPHTPRADAHDTADLARTAQH